MLEIIKATGGADDPFDANKKESWLLAAGEDAASVEKMSESERWSKLTASYAARLQEFLIPAYNAGATPAALLRIKSKHNSCDPAVLPFFLEELRAMSDTKTDDAVCDAYARAEERTWKTFVPDRKECWLAVAGVAMDDIRSLDTRGRFAAVTRLLGLHMKDHLIPLCELGVSPEFIIDLRNKGEPLTKRAAEHLIIKLKEEAAATIGDHNAGTPRADADASVSPAALAPDCAPEPNVSDKGKSKPKSKSAPAPLTPAPPKKKAK